MAVVHCAHEGCRSYVDTGVTALDLVQDLVRRGWQTVSTDGGKDAKHYCQIHKDPAVRTQPVTETMPVAVPKDGEGERNAD